MSTVVVVGGGFAGVWSAAAAVRVARETGTSAGDLTVTLISDRDDVVIRPRLYQAEPAAMRVPLDSVVGPVGVRRIAATATAIDSAARVVRVVTGDGAHTTVDYDRLVLATGSAVVRPVLPGAQRLFDVDTVEAATALEDHLRRLPSRPPTPDRFTAVVVGAGFTGLEIATELVDRLRGLAGGDAMRVVLVERADRLGPELGEGPCAEIAKALAALGVEVRLGVAVAAVTDDVVELSDGTAIPAATVVWSAGVRASVLTAQLDAPRDRLGRLEVDEYLRVPRHPQIYAAGDTAAAWAEPGQRVMPSCQHAIPMGKFAGHNAAAALLGLPEAPFAPDPYVTCLDLGSAGAVFTTGWARQVALTGADAKRRKRAVNEEWIYPPADDPDELLRQADFRVSVRRPLSGSPA
jgi:NADH dehydrogenase